MLLDVYRDFQKVKKLQSSQEKRNEAGGDSSDQWSVKSLKEELEVH